MYKRILVPLDGSELAEQVLPYVRTLGTALGARVELLRVAEPVYYGAEYARRGLYLDQVITSVLHKHQDYLEGVARPLRKAGLQVVSMVHEGSPAGVIVREAGSEPDTLVAMTTHGRSGIARWLLGSVTDKVLHAVGTPLLVVRSQAERPPPDAEIKGLIVPLDESELAEQVLPHVTSLAKALKVPLVLLTVVSTLQLDIAYSEFPSLSYEDQAQVAEAEARQYLEMVQGKLRSQGLHQVECRVVRGRVAESILDVARQLPHHLVAMTTHGRSGIARWMLGSVADRVVTHSVGPVLMVRAVAE